MSSARGFTLIELILSISIILIVGSFSSVFFSRFLSQNSVEDTKSQLVGEMRKAQIYSMMGRQDSGWGVAYTPGLITLFQGNTFATRNRALDETFTVSSATTIYNLSEIDFYRLTGTPSSTPVITIAGSGTNETMSINSQGIVNR